MFIIKVKNMQELILYNHLWVCRLCSKFVSSFSMFVIQQDDTIICADCHLVVVWWPC